MCPAGKAPARVTCPSPRLQVLAKALQLEREAGFSLLATSYSHSSAKMAHLMIIVFLVEAAVRLINAVGAAKINDLVRLVELASSFMFSPVLANSILYSYGRSSTSSPCRPPRPPPSSENCRPSTSPPAES